MELSLRRASVLQSAIRQAIAELSVALTCQVSIYEKSVGAALDAQVRVLEGTMRERAELLDALYELRKEVGRKNASSGIDDLLADLARNNAELELYAQLVGAQPREDEEILAGRMARRREPSQNAYQAQEDVLYVGFLTEARIAAFKEERKRLRLERQALQDRVAELNVKTTITLAPKTVEVLQRAALV